MQPTIRARSASETARPRASSINRTASVFPSVFPSVLPSAFPSAFPSSDVEAA